MASMLATLNQKSDDSEEEFGQGGRLTPVVGMASSTGAMGNSGGGRGNGNDEDDSHKEEEDALEPQWQL